MSCGVKSYEGGINHNLTSGANGTDNPFASFFGPHTDVVVENKDRYPHETYNLPKAYEGKNIYLERQIWWMLNQAEFFVEKLCPWEQTEQLHVKWDIWKFNHTLADLEPEQGVPRFVTQERESRSDSLVRRGLAFMIEHGFYKTAEGQEHYLMNLRQIVDAVHTTVYYGVLSALLNAKNHYKAEQADNMTNGSQMEDIMQQERERWGIAQKTERGMYVLDARIKDAMARENVVPDVWVFPPRMAIYLTMVPSSEVEYYRKGAGAADNIEKGKANMLKFRGSTVYEAQAIDVDFAGEPRDMLTRDRMIGSYFTMYDHIPKEIGKDLKYKSDMRSTYIYDMSADKFKKITLTRALECCDFDAWIKWCATGDSKSGTIPSVTTLYNLAIKVKQDPVSFFTRSKISRKTYVAWYKDIQVDMLSSNLLDSDFAAPDSVGRGGGDDGLESKEGEGEGSSGGGQEDGLAGLGRDSQLYKTQTLLQKEVASAHAKFASSRSSAAKAKYETALTKAKSTLDTWTATNAVALKKAETYMASGPKAETYMASGAVSSTVVTKIMATMLFNKNDMAKLIQADLRIPVAFLLMRPFQRYEMSSAILAKGGKDLGITYHGHHDFMLTDDVVHKTHMGHYTFYSKTVIRNPNHFAIAEDVFCTGYRGGEGCEFFSPIYKGEDELTIGKAIDNGDAKTRSILCVAISPDQQNENGKDYVLNPCSLTGQHIVEDVKFEALCADPTHPSCDFLKKAYETHFWDLGQTDPLRFQQDYEKVNRCCFQGRQQIYNWNQQDFSNEIQETGHWGSQGTYAGCRAARTGRDVFLKRPDHMPAFL